MAGNYYFFTQLEYLKNTNGFGPDGTYPHPITSETCDNYRLTSMYVSTGTSLAYAVCKGMVFVQAQGGDLKNDLLNIVLKPFEQPPFEFPKIRYFIYKGIKKSSLLDPNDKDLAAASHDNDLLTSVWSDTTGGTPSADVLGLDINSSTHADTGLLDPVFYRSGSGIANQLPVVHAGWKIGEFDADSFGFEIMFESLGFDPTLELARNHEHFVRVKTLPPPGSYSQAEFFEHWHDKEEILNYIDPCAFFSSFYSHKLKVYDTVSTPAEGRKAEDLYNTVIKLYKNNDRCYVDIRNEFNFSVNYFKNYGPNSTDNYTGVQISSDPSDPNPSFNTLDYYTDGWPLLMLTASEISADSGRYIVRMKLPDGNGDNPMPLIYFSKAYYNNPTLFPKERKSAEKFATIEDDAANLITTEFSFAFPEVSGALMSGYARINYLKTFQAFVPPLVFAPTRYNVLDSIFINSQEIFTDIPAGNTKVFEDEFYVDLMHFDAERKIVRKALMKDSNTNVTFMLMKKLTFISSKFHASVSPYMVTEKPINSNNLQEYLKVKANLLPQDQFLVNGQVETIDNGYLNFPGMTDTPMSINAKNDILYLTFSNSEIIQLRNLILANFHTKYISYVTFDIGAVSGIDEDSDTFFTADINLVGYDKNGTGTLDTIPVSTSIQKKIMKPNVGIYNNS